jgi:hypothetical protein
MKQTLFDILVFLALISLVFLSTSSYGKMVTIGIIDTGLHENHFQEYQCPNIDSADFTGTGIHDRSGHGTNVTSLITKDLDNTKFCIVTIKYNKESRPKFKIDVFLKNITDFIFVNSFEYTNAILYAIEKKLNYVNISSSGSTTNEMEQAGLQILLNNGTKVVVAAGNKSLDLEKNCKAYPGCNGYNHKNFYVIGSRDRNGNVSRFSNYGGPVNGYTLGEDQGYSPAAKMSGTSQSAANFTNMLIKKENP